MWIFTPKGFLCIVQHNAMPGHFQVKSRTVEPLEHFWSGYDIEEIDWADYRFRITIQKKEAIEVLSREIESIGYTNFKDESRQDHDYHDALVHVWMTMYEYQSKRESEPRRS